MRSADRFPFRTEEAGPKFDGHDTDSGPQFALLKLLALGAILFLSGCVDTLGRNIPQDDLWSDYIRALVWAAILSLTVAFAPIGREHRRLLLTYWGVKVSVSLGAMLFYEYAYGLDAYHYFASAQGPFIWQGLKFGTGTSNMVHFAWLHEHIVPDSYHAMKVTCSLVGLWGVYFFYRAATLFLGRESPKTFWILALYPSVIFWSSILGKDPIVLLGISLYIYGIMLWATKEAWSGLAIALAGLIVAILIRTWLGPILIAPTAVFLIVRSRSLPLQIILGLAAGAAFLTSTEGLLEKFNVETSEDLFMTANTISRSWARGGSGQQLNSEFTSIGAMIRFMPLGITAALFRPLPFEVLNPFGLLAGIENTALIYLLIRAVKRTRLKDLKNPVLSWMLLTIGTWATVYGFVSYQNLGSAVRFRLQILPLLLIVLLHLSQMLRDTQSTRPPQLRRTASTSRRGAPARQLNRSHC